MLGSSGPHALVCFNWNSFLIRNNSSGYHRTQLGRCGMHPGQKKVSKPGRWAHTFSPKVGVKLKPYWAEQAPDPKQVISSLSTDFEAGLWVPGYFRWWNVEKQPPPLVKQRGRKQWSCVPASPGFPSPLGACNWPDCTPSTLHSCNFLTNLSMTSNFPFYIIHEFLILAAPCKSSGSDCVIKKPQTASQSCCSSQEQYSWHRKRDPLE